MTAQARLRIDVQPRIFGLAETMEKLAAVGQAYIALGDALLSASSAMNRYADMVPCPEDGEPGPDAMVSALCPSCGHGQDIHDADGRCWYTVGSGVNGADLVCPCLVRESADD